MSLQIGIVGLPNVGKSTLFCALTKHNVAVENYPFCTIDPSVGVVPVPDTRLNNLSKFSNTEKEVPAIVEFVDIAGLVKGASEGEGLGNKFLSNIREVDAILHTVRFFDDIDVIHVSGEIDPVKDMEVINLELMLSDLERVNARMSKLERDVKKNDKDAVAEQEVMTKVLHSLRESKPVRSLSFTEEELVFVKQAALLTAKPMLYALNIKTGGHNLQELNDGRAEKAFDYIQEQGGQYVLMDAQTERDLNDVADEDKDSFRQELGAQGGGLIDLIKKSYEILGLITFFTTGEKETRAWTIKSGSTAPIAGAAIHNDFKDKFIRAEVIGTSELLEAGSYAKARDLGKVRTEGKEYVVKDGDVMVFLHS
ncbi:redox-regulated ATPase YchF [Candidatus Wolfebacteria bacterium]|nr:redox-regulated ATPase YchF [Candidatus Wolfebacteria bacterium]